MVTLSYSDLRSILRRLAYAEGRHVHDYMQGWLRYIERGEGDLTPPMYLLAEYAVGRMLARSSPSLEGHSRNAAMGLDPMDYTLLSASVRRELPEGFQEALRAEDAAISQPAR